MTKYIDLISVLNSVT